ncbi:MAG: dephospho-CoA kinase [Vampirovibrionales bacterium]
MSVRIALTGGIASGKSSVQAWLVSQGVPVVDADDLTHALYKTPELKAYIAQHFGWQVFEDRDNEKEVNRKALGAIVFANPEKRALLNAYIHPRVKAAADAFVSQHANQPLVVVSIPLLFEVYSLETIRERFDGVWLVVATPEQQRRRLVDKRGLTDADAEARLLSQWPIEQKVALLYSPWKGPRDGVIDNTGLPQAWVPELERLMAACTP